MRVMSALVAVVLASAAIVQDPIRPVQPPLGADPLPLVPDPPMTAVERRDLVRPFLPPTGYEGFYRLSAIVGNGRVVTEGVAGYLAIGREHLSLHVIQAGPPELAPLVQSGFRRYRVEKGELVTTALAGVDNFVDGKLRFDPFGLTERRQLVRTATALRVVQRPGEWMEFQRIE